MSRTLHPCGTRGAYIRHLRRHEPIDDACRDANRAYQRKHYSGATRVEAEERTARLEALEALANRHPKEFGLLLARVIAEDTDV